MEQKDRSRPRPPRAVVEAAAISGDLAALMLLLVKAFVVEDDPRLGVALESEGGKCKADRGVVGHARRRSVANPSAIELVLEGLELLPIDLGHRRDRDLDVVAGNDQRL